MPGVLADDTATPILNNSNDWVFIIILYCDTYTDHVFIQGYVKGYQGRQIVISMEMYPDVLKYVYCVFTIMFNIFTKVSNEKVTHFTASNFQIHISEVKTI